MADVGDAGFRIFGHDDARRDVGAAVLGAVLRHRKIANVDGVAGDDLLLAGRGVLSRGTGGIGLSRPVQDLVENGGFVGLECQQRLVPRFE